MIYVIVGPTGSGKTSIACHLSDKFNLPIVNADAFQIYQEMNVGTAKIEKNDPIFKKHYLIDIVNPSQKYSVKQYRDDFDRAFPKLLENNKDIIICGGTGLYIRAALFDYEFPKEEEFDYSKYDDFSNEELHQMLERVDPHSAETIHTNNRKRVIRALVFAENSGFTKSENIAHQEHKMRFDNVEILFLNPNREDLYQHINDRVDQMFDNGLVEEVETLLKKYLFSFNNRTAKSYFFCKSTV